MAVPVVPVSPLLAPAATVISTRTGRRLEDSEDFSEEAADVSPEDTSHEGAAGPLVLHTAASANEETVAEDTTQEQEAL